MFLRLEQYLVGTALDPSRNYGGWRYGQRRQERPGCIAIITPHHLRMHEGEILIA